LALVALVYLAIKEIMVIILYFQALHLLVAGQVEQAQTEIMEMQEVQAAVLAVIILLAVQQVQQDKDLLAVALVGFKAQARVVGVQAR
jgi:hypothetical protein